MEDWFTLIFLFIGISTVILLRKTTRNGSKLPPGPKGTLGVGYMPFLGRNHHIMFRDLAKTYGSIVRIKVGTASIVGLNDFESIRKVLTHKAVQNRTKSVFLEESQCPGFATLNGEAWHENRQLTVKLLRELGWGTAATETSIKEECQILVNTLSELNGEPVLIRKFTMSSISAHITTLLFGVRYTHDHPVRIYLNNCFKTAGQILSLRTLVIFVPIWFYRILGLIPYSRYYTVKAAFREVVKFIKKQVYDHKETKNDHCSRDYIDAFLKETTHRRNDLISHIRIDYLPGNVLNMFGGGTNSVNRSLAWNLLICAAYPDMTQRRMQEEIDRVVGFERQPTWEDRYEMPFVMAVIREVHRWRTVVPVGIPRSASEDVSIGNYVIPKDTIVMANIWAVHMDPNLWDNPEEFNPSRFLEDGKLTISPAYLIPFSVGKRMCPAEKVSAITLFMFLTALLQKFIILPEEGKQIDLSSDCVTFNSPVSQKLRFIPRVHNIQGQ